MANRIITPDNPGGPLFQHKLGGPTILHHPLPAPPPNVVKGPDPAPVTDATPVEWASSLDMLKSLVHDIESGRLAMPDMAYVALLQMNPEDRSQKRYPTYFYVGDDNNYPLITLLGLLTKHIAQINE